MTFEEIQAILQQMLAIQKELQNSQLKFGESLVDLKQSVSDLKEVSQRHERRLEQLIGYSITGEADRLDILQRIQNFERRLTKLEQNDQSS